jgi:hypothetical protein
VVVIRKYIPNVTTAFRVSVREHRTFDTGRKSDGEVSQTVLPVYDVVQHENQFHLIILETVRSTEESVKSMKNVSLLSTTFVPNIFRSD